MTIAFAILALITLVAALAAMSWRNLVHCALSTVVALAGLAMLFLQLGAEFLGFAQVLVYVGAVAILIVFAILLTRGADPEAPVPVVSAAGWGIALALATFLVLAGAVLSSPVVSPAPPPPPPALSVRAIGEKLMHEYVLPLEAIGLLLTAAMIGAVVIALQERRAR